MEEYWELISIETDDEEIQEIKFANELAHYSSNTFRPPGSELIAALGHEKAKEGLLKLNAKGYSMLELAIMRLKDRRHFPDDVDFLLQLIEKMFEVTPDIITVKGGYERPPLFVAILFKVDTRVLPTLANHCEINQQDENGLTALHFACRFYDPYNSNRADELLKLNKIDVTKKTLLGKTPLDLALLSTFDDDEEKDNEDKICADDACDEKRYEEGTYLRGTLAPIVKRLLAKGCNPTNLYTAKFAASEIRQTSLHLAAQRSYYHELKSMLDAIQKKKNSQISQAGSMFDEKDDTWDANRLDSEGFSTLHRAVLIDDFDIIYLLLRYSIIDLHAKTADGKTAMDLAKSEEMKKWLDDKAKERAELNQRKTHWIKSLDFSYYRRSDKSRSIDIEGEQHHLLLKAMEASTRTSGGNHATASLNFILTTKEGYISDHVVDITAESYSHVRDKLNDKDEREKYLQSLDIKELEFAINKCEKVKSKASPDIKKENKDFDFAHSHSEQALFLWLFDDNNLEKMAGELVNIIPNFTEDEYKVVAIVLNVYTELYMCHNCQAVTLAFQEKLNDTGNPKFKSSLVQALAAQGIKTKVKNNVPITVVVTASKPYIFDRRANPSEELCRFTEEDHQEVSVDLRTVPDGHIFFKDISRVNLSTTTFVSRFNSTISSLEQQLSKLRREHNEIQKEKERLKQENAELKIENNQLKTLVENEKATALNEPKYKPASPSSISCSLTTRFSLGTAPTSTTGKPAERKGKKRERSEEITETKNTNTLSSSSSKIHKPK